MTANAIKLFLKNKSKSISFDEKDHIYLLNGVELKSVTRVIGTYSQPFDINGNILKSCARRDGLTVDEMKAKWEDVKNEACTRGTSFHDYLEKRVRAVSEKLPDICLRYTKSSELFLKWLKSKNWVLVDTEVIVYDENKGIAGQIDLLVYDLVRKKLIILDYKTNKKIVRDNKYKKFMITPFHDYADNNYNHYSLQLNIYAGILRDWGLDVAEEKVLLHFSDNKFAVILCDNTIYDKFTTIEKF